MSYTMPSLKLLMWQYRGNVMKILLLLLTSSCLIGMAQQPSPKLLPLLTHIPFEGDEIKLTSFAQSLISGTLGIGSEYTKGNFRIILFFDDFINPETGYCISSEEASHATRFILADHLRKLIKHEEESLEDLEQLASTDETNLRIRHIRHTKNRIQEYTTCLATFNVSESLLALLPSTNDLLKKVELLQIKETDSEKERELKREQIIEILRTMKKEPSLLRAITCERFYRFWRCEDLESTTPNDAQRDLPTIKATRVAFFEALKTNNYNALDSLAKDLSEKKKTIVKKETRTVYQFLNKLIEFYRAKRDLDPHSPENSDEELW